ncbi:MAG: type IV pilus assembly protein FimV, partial [Methylophilaceae bacterium]
MLTKIKIFLVLSLLIPVSVSGAGLGRIAVKSGLGEPLSAEIELIESPSEEVASLAAHIGSAQDYASSGLSDAYIP